jgi:AraC-like DNA-binding protein
MSIQNYASVAADRSQTARIELFRLWDVSEDERYRVERTWDSWESPGSQMPLDGRTGIVAARTISGEGWVETTAGERLTLRPDTVLIRPWLSLAKWGTAKDRWRFYWFEFFADDLEHFAIDQPVVSVVETADLAAIADIKSRLRSPHPATRRCASAGFSAMLYRWLEAASNREAAHRGRPAVQRAIDLMHEQLDRSLPVPEMAKHAGLSTRAFATTFEQITGQTPKRYHLNLRLDAARALLLTGRANVKEAAAQLGFSSPFYLSKLYRKRFGHPPSQTR